MQWLSIIATVGLWVTVLGHHNHDHDDHRICRQPIAGHTCYEQGNGRFHVDGSYIEMKQHHHNKFELHCTGAPVLESPAMPHFLHSLYTSRIELRGCSVPTTNAYGALFTYYNVIPQQTYGELSLELSYFNSNQKLAAHHFADLGSVTAIELRTDVLTTVEANLFSLLPYLRILSANDIIVAGVEDGMGLSSIITNTLQKVHFDGWREKNLEPLKNCDNLMELSLNRPLLEQLPEDWLALCPALKRLTLKNAERLVSLQSRVFHGASSLVSLQITQGSLQTVASDAFQGLHILQYLTLSYNKLTEEALQAMSALTSLIKLDVRQNLDIKDVCDANGYSSLRNLVQLSSISFQHTAITRICRDWREDLVNLQNLDLSGTNIRELSYEDFKFKRNPVTKCEVSLQGCAISSVHLNENDYNKAVAAPVTAYPVRINWDTGYLICDCDLYWFRKAIDRTVFTNVFRSNRFRCNDNTYLMMKTPAQVCPELAHTVN